MTGFPRPAGSVSYAYRIGKYEISEQKIDKANALDGLGITKDSRGPNKPATSVSWFEAAQFVNWLNMSAGSSPAYKFDGSGNFQLWGPADPGYDASNLFRNSQAKYFLPSANEWYKAAYYDPTVGVYWDYPTGSNALPIAVPNGTSQGTAVVMQDPSAGPADIFRAGGLSPYRTMAQGGNVGEWEESALDLVNDESNEMRGARGGNWPSFASSLASPNRFATQSNNQGPGLGFRVASIVPEPKAAVLLATAAAVLLRPRRGTSRRFRLFAAPRGA
jgi:formylglycine-generating enzyme